MRWQDDKGFGFIRTEQLAQEVFFHIHQYRGRQRPAVGETVFFQLGAGKQGKPQAVSVQTAEYRQAQQQRVLRQQRQQQAAFDAGRSVMTLLALLLYPLLLVAAALGWLFWQAWLWYLVAGALTFFAYWKDKRAAEQGSWRTPENTLHLFSLLGGWPGALLAQTWLRHKSTKMPFRLIFWLTVGANLALLALAMHQGWLRHGG